jgi:hypothetical protein
LRGKASHLLYLWHLTDKQEVLAGMVQVLSKFVAVDCNCIHTNTTKVQNKRKAKKKEEAEEKREAKRF